MDKTKGEGGGGEGRWVCLGWGGGMGRKCRQLQLNNNKKRKYGLIEGVCTEQLTLFSSQVHNAHHSGVYITGKIIGAFPVKKIN